MQSARSIIIMVLLLWPPAVHAAAWQWIDSGRVRTMLTEGSSLWLIDVRSAAAYDAAHIEGSTNIPGELLAHKSFPRRKTLILVDDALGQRTARDAAASLVQKGHEQVFVLRGGVTGWKHDGLPMVEREALSRGVTAGDLKWAMGQSVPMKLYDLRDSGVRQREPLQGGGEVAGATVAERVETLRGMLAPAPQKNGLAERLQQGEPVILVLPAAEDGEAHVRSLRRTANADIRYLIGGYEALGFDSARATQTIGACPTCPEKRR